MITLNSRPEAAPEGPSEDRFAHLHKLSLDDVAAPPLVDAIEFPEDTKDPRVAVGFEAEDPVIEAAPAVETPETVKNPRLAKIAKNVGKRVRDFLTIETVKAKTPKAKAAKEVVDEETPESEETYTFKPSKKDLPTGRALTAQEFHEHFGDDAGPGYASVYKNKVLTPYKINGAYSWMHPNSRRPVEATNTDDEVSTNNEQPAEATDEPKSKKDRLVPEDVALDVTDQVVVSDDTAEAKARVADAAWKAQVEANRAQRSVKEPVVAKEVKTPLGATAETETRIEGALHHPRNRAARANRERNVQVEATQTEQEAKEAAELQEAYKAVDRIRQSFLATVAAAEADKVAEQKNARKASGKTVMKPAASLQVLPARTAKPVQPHVTVPRPIGTANGRLTNQLQAGRAYQSAQNLESLDIAKIVAGEEPAPEAFSYEVSQATPTSKERFKKVASTAAGLALVGAQVGVGALNDRLNNRTRR